MGSERSGATVLVRLIAIISICLVTMALMHLFSIGRARTESYEYDHYW